jgi:hypothetical protein
MGIFGMMTSCIHDARPVDTTGSTVTTCTIIVFVTSSPVYTLVKNWTVSEDDSFLAGSLGEQIQKFFFRTIPPETETTGVVNSW